MKPRLFTPGGLFFVSLEGEVQMRWKQGRAVVRSCANCKHYQRRKAKRGVCAVDREVAHTFLCCPHWVLSEEARSVLAKDIPGYGVPLPVGGRSKHRPESQRIYDAIAANGEQGITTIELEQNFPGSNVRGIVSRLYHNGEISIAGYPGNRLAWALEEHVTKPVPRKHVHTGPGSLRSRILVRLKEGEATTRDLSSELMESEQAIRYHLRVLKLEGRIKSSPRRAPGLNRGPKAILWSA